MTGGSLAGMRAVVPDELIEERRRLGLDRHDEMWDGVLHMLPPASSSHNEVGADLARILGRIALTTGLRRFNEPGVFDPEIADMTSYRVPDLGYARPGDVSDRGIEGRAVLVVEVLSPKDESYEKLPFYRRVGVEELLYIEPKTRAFEVRRPEDDGWRIVAPGGDGWTPLASLDVGLRRSGDVLRVRSDAGIEEV
jgi:Uma2 family endonuclease